MKILVAEIWPVHEECLPAWVYTLNRLGIKPDILLNKKMLATKGSPLEWLTSLNTGKTYQWHPLDEDRVAEEINDSKYELIFANSLQGVSPSFYKRLNARIVGIIHHYPELRPEDIDSFELEVGTHMGADHLSRPRLIPVVLWGFIRDFANRDTSLDARVKEKLKYLYPLTPASISKLARPLSLNHERGPIRICIPGGINFNNRDYSTIFKALEGVNTSQIRVVIPGGGKPDQVIRMAKLTEHIREALEFNLDINKVDQQAESRVPYSQYLHSIASADIVAPLIKERSRYLTRSITSSISTALSHGVPLALSFTESRIYNINYSFGCQPQDAVPAVLDAAKADSDNLRMLLTKNRLEDASLVAELLSHNVKTVSEIICDCAG
jgi:hypothetical protein